MSTQRVLSDEQERLRSEGLRALARMIARRALADHGRACGPSTGERPDVPAESQGAREPPRQSRSA